MKLSDVKEIPTERDADQRERMLRGDMYFSADEALVKERHRAGGFAAPTTPPRRSRGRNAPACSRSCWAARARR